LIYLHFHSKVRRCTSKRFRCLQGSALIEADSKEPLHKSATRVILE